VSSRLCPAATTPSAPTTSTEEAPEAQPGVYIHDSTFDAAAFVRELHVARDLTGGEAFAEADARHLQWVVRLEQRARLVGNVLAAAVVLVPRDCLPLSLAIIMALPAVLLVALARAVRWTVIAHHVSHGGYDKLAGRAGGLAPHYHRGAFGTGSLYARARDWLDWLLPEAWNVEHNKLHHYFLSESSDPDLVEANFHKVRAAPVSPLLKFIVAVPFSVLTWRWSYYAPNALRELHRRSNTYRHLFPMPPDGTRDSPMLLDQLLLQPLYSLVQGDVALAVAWAHYSFSAVLSMLPLLLLLSLPVIVLHFVFGMYDEAVRALWLVAAAEALTNVITFVNIVCNHSGADLYRFDTPCVPHSAEFYLRSVYASANFTCGTEARDLLHGYLNYQVEHHIFPSLTAPHYRRLQPLVKALCAKYSVAYTQQPALQRTLCMLRVMCGSESMKRVTAVLPPALQRVGAGRAGLQLA
jgi:fatty acid desaturase